MEYFEFLEAAEEDDPKAVREHQDDLREVMGTGAGRRVLSGLLEGAKVFDRVFSQDPYLTAFQEGRRDIGLALRADLLTACPDLYLKARAEANERKERQNG